MVLRRFFGMKVSGFWKGYGVITLAEVERKSGSTETISRCSGTILTLL